MMNRFSPFFCLTFMASVFMLAFPVLSADAQSNSAPPRPPSKNGSSAAPKPAPSTNAAPPTNAAPNKSQQQAKPSQTQPTHEKATSLDHMQIIIPKAYEINSVLQLDGVVLCIELMTNRAAENFVHYFEKNNLQFETIHSESRDEMVVTYLSQQCDGMVYPALETDDFILGMTNGGDNSHMVLPEIMK